jgi:membrane associated rhomboid family serine protease
MIASMGTSSILRLIHPVLPSAIADIFILALGYIGQLYGLILYYAIPIFDEFNGGALKAVSRPEWIYFWVSSLLNLLYPQAVRAPN